MTPRIRRSVLVLAAMVALAAAPALALIPCEDCFPGMPPGTRCVGVCNGMIIRFCFDWWFYGCPVGFAPGAGRAAVQSEDEFIRSLLVPPDGEPPGEVSICGAP